MESLILFKHTIQDLPGITLGWHRYCKPTGHIWLEKSNCWRLAPILVLGLNKLTALEREEVGVKIFVPHVNNPSLIKTLWNACLRASGKKFAVVITLIETVPFIYDRKFLCSAHFCILTLSAFYLCHISKSKFNNLFCTVSSYFFARKNFWTPILLTKDKRHRTPFVHSFF